MGPFEECAPVAVEYAAAVASALANALEDRGWSVAEAARQSGHTRAAVAGIVQGRTYADMVILADLEKAVGVRLWRADPYPGGAGDR